jgi:DNA helicase-2/ATP-dependent DNA helicase PcrA
VSSEGPISSASGAADSASVPGLEDDAEGARVVAEEMRLLGVVTAALAVGDASATSATEARQAYDERLIELRDLAAAAKPEDLPALFDQMHALGALREQRGKSVVSAVDPKCPYFGHMRLEEAGKRRDVLIGARSHLDSARGVRIVDWRNAPVSRIFYRYQEEDEYEERLGDRLVQGTMLARRTVAIVAGQLRRVTSPQGTFVADADGTWKRVAAHAARLTTDKDKPRLGVGGGAARDGKMLPAIASMLDATQYEMITRPGAGLIAIQGSAGSGKTTVGLHRVGYLAFADPARFRPERMLVVMPHDGLVHFVGTVLPGLGVEGVRVTTFARWAAPLVHHLFPRLPAHVSDETPAVVARAKAHPAILRGVDRLAAAIADAMSARVAQAMERWPRGADVVKAWGDGAVERRTPLQRASALGKWADGASLPDVTKSAVTTLVSELQKRARDVVGAWDELVTSRELLVRTLSGEGFSPTQIDQIHDWCVRQARTRSEGERDGDSPTLDAEDAGLLLRFWQVLRGPLEDSRGPLRYAHMFVDEVQDASPVELKVLLESTTKEKNITLAGDTAQRMLDDEVEHVAFDWDRLLTELEVPHTKLEPLRVSYRSTAEITSFARSVLGPFAHEAEPIATRHGPAVEHFAFSSTGEAVVFLADALRQLAAEEPLASVALVARFPQQAAVYYDGLARAEVPNVRLITDLDFTWSSGVDVTDVRQTKGLEFDEVVLIDTNATSYPDTARARNTLYVGATRAAHQLWCISSDTPSPVVVAALQSATV